MPHYTAMVIAPEVQKGLFISEARKSPEKVAVFYSCSNPDAIDSVAVYGGDTNHNKPTAPPSPVTCDVMTKYWVSGTFVKKYPLFSKV